MASFLFEEIELWLDQEQVWVQMIKGFNWILRIMIWIFENSVKMQVIHKSLWFCPIIGSFGQFGIIANSEFLLFDSSIYFILSNNYGRVRQAWQAIVCGRPHCCQGGACLIRFAFYVLILSGIGCERLFSSESLMFFHLMCIFLLLKELLYIFQEL